MSRTIAELENETRSLGVSVRMSGKKYSKKDYEEALRNYYWNLDHPGKKMPEQIEPMLARNAKDLDEATVNSMLMDGSKFVAQEKLDGCRMVFQILPDGNYITSRRVSDKTYRMAENQDQVEHLRDMKFPPQWMGAVLDGEMISPKDVVKTRDIETANQLQACVALLALEPEESNRAQREQDCRLIYRVFDMIKGPNGVDLTKKSYETRRHYIDSLFNDMKELGFFTDNYLDNVPVIRENKKEFYETIVRQGGEGIMLKDVNSVYCSTGRPASWFKMKKFVEMDAFVTGFIPAEPDKGFAGLVGAIEFSVYDENSGKQVSVAMCPNMTLEDRKAMTEMVEGQPTLKKEYYGRVAEVRGQEFSVRKRHLVHARLMRWREGADYKGADQCVYNIDAMIAVSNGLSVKPESVSEEANLFEMSE